MVDNDDDNDHHHQFSYQHANAVAATAATTTALLTASTSAAAMGRGRGGVAQQQQQQQYQSRQCRQWLMAFIVVFLCLTIGILVLPEVLLHHQHYKQLQQQQKSLSAEGSNNDDTDDNNTNTDGSIISVQEQKFLLNHPAKLQKLLKNSARDGSHAAGSGGDDAAARGGDGDAGTSGTAAIAAVAVSAAAAPVLLSPGCEATVMIIRHCEKHGPLVTDAHGHQHCSYVGWERNYFLTTLFGESSNAQRRWPVPAVLYALSPHRGDNNNNAYNFREWETLMPLASKFDLPIHVQYENGYHLAMDVFAQLQSGRMCGKLMLISWKHSLFVDLATALGCGPDDGCPTQYPEDSFDQVWQIKYVYHVQPVAAPPQAAAEAAGGTGTGAGEATPAHAVTTSYTSNTTKQHHHRSKQRLRRQLGHHQHPQHHHHHQQQLLSSDENHHPFRQLDESVPNEQQQRQQQQQDGEWSIYGAVSSQNFDPLQFSHQVGDYPIAGSAVGGKWASTATATTTTTTMASTTVTNQANQQRHGDEM